MKTVFRILFAVGFVVVTLLTVIPNPDDVAPGSGLTRWFSLALFGDVTHADKVAHFIAYGGLGGLAALSRLPAPRIAWWGPAALAAWGAVLEVVQGFVAERYTEGLDAVVNAFGAACGWAGGLVMLAAAARLSRPAERAA